MYDRFSYGSASYGGSALSSIEICNWITSKGGWQAITAYDIMTLVSAYLGQTNLGFTVEMRYINGAIAYYLDMLTSGNDFTECSSP